MKNLGQTGGRGGRKPPYLGALGEAGLSPRQKPWPAEATALCLCTGNANWGASFETNESLQPLSLEADFSGGFTSPRTIPNLP